MVLLDSIALELMQTRLGLAVAVLVQADWPVLLLLPDPPELVPGLDP